MVEPQGSVLPEADREQYEQLHDRETGLPGWALLLDRTDNALARARRIKRAVAVLAVEDLLPIGDEVLDVRAVAEAMHAGLRPDDTVARVGPRSLFIVRNDVREAEDASLVARRLVVKAGVRCRLGIVLGFGMEDATRLLGSALEQARAQPYRVA